MSKVFVELSMSLDGLSPWVQVSDCSTTWAQQPLNWNAPG